MDTDIYKICGESDLLPEIEKIQSDPNFVFEPDPSFNPITLFNEIGDTIMVNSWIECANYVNGGWTNTYSNFTGDIFFLFLSAGLTISYFIGRYIFKRKLQIEN